MEADRERWDRRWADSGPTADEIVPCPPDALAASPDLLGRAPTVGRALDLACGAGAVALWMADRGLDVTALDVSPVAISLLDDAAARLGLQVDARVADTDGGLPADVTDLALVVCQRYRATNLHTELARRLAPGGMLVVTVLSEVGLVGTDRAGEVGPFHAPAGELGRAYADSGLDVLADVEEDGQASIVLIAPDHPSRPPARG